MLGCAAAFATPAFASTYDHSYTNATQGHWSGTWWDHTTSKHSVKTTNTKGCATSLSGTDKVTYRMHQWNGILPATSLGDHELGCTSGANASWTTLGGDHEYQWQLVGINGQGSGGTATASTVRTTYP